MHGYREDTDRMDISIYNTPLGGYQKDEYRKFLESCGLRDEEDADFIVWGSEDGQLMASGALSGHIIKQLAVAPEAEGQGVMAAVISAVISEAAARGVYRLFLCTKPANRSMFSSLGFYEVAATDDALLMENRRDGVESFIDSIPRFDGVRGAVVCNCDPFTLGHRHLIEHAAAACDSLYVFAVSESGSMFTPDERLEMIRKGTQDIPGCCVLASDLYLVSRATFPAYFIKDKVKAEEVRSDLDIVFFSEKLAPALGITRRFVGEEPLDPVTDAYNRRMKELLPARGIGLEEIPRRRDSDGEIISASRVRKLIAEAAQLTAGEADSKLEQIRDLVPESTYDAVLRHLNK